MIQSIRATLPVTSHKVDRNCVGVGHPQLVFLEVSEHPRDGGVYEVCLGLRGMILTVELLVDCRFQPSIRLYQPYKTRNTTRPTRRHNMGVCSERNRTGKGFCVGWYFFTVCWWVMSAGRFIYSISLQSLVSSSFVWMLQFCNFYSCLLFWVWTVDMSQSVLPSAVSCYYICF